MEPQVFMAPIFGLTDSPGDWAEPSPGYVVQLCWRLMESLQTLDRIILEKLIKNINLNLGVIF